MSTLPAAPPGRAHAALPARAWAFVEATRPARLFLWLYLLALGATLLFGLFLGYRHGPEALEFDEREYWDLSSQLLDGSFLPFPRRTAAFPLILAGLRLAAPNFLAVQMLMSALFAFSAPILFLLARKLSGSTATGFAAGLLLVAWPPTTFYGAKLYSEAAALPLFLLALLLLPLGARAAGRATPPALGAALSVGLVLALATQVRTMYLLFLPCALALLFLEERRIGMAARRAVLLVAGFALVTLPWSAYMSARFGHPILVTSNGGETLSGGLGPRLLALGRMERTTTSDRTTWLGPGKWLPIGESGYLSPDEVRRLPYDRQDALLRQRTLAWIGAHPRDAAYLQGCKLAYMWGLYRMADNGTAQLLFGNLAIVALLLAALAALALRPGLWRRTPRLWIVPLFVSGVALISWGSWRFRQPADAALVALVAIGWLPLLLPAQSAPGARRAR